MKNEILRKIIFLIEAVLSGIIAIWLSASVIMIYRENVILKIENPLLAIYTPEIIYEKFSQIAPLFLIFILIAIAGLFFRIDTKSKINHEFMLFPVRKNYKFLQIILILVSFVLILAGIFNGSAKDVLYKAINICTECIGLG